jgi:hypothetical protein
MRSCSAVGREQVNEPPCRGATLRKSRPSKVLEKCQLNFDAKAGDNQVIGFSNTDCGGDKWPLFSLEEFDDLGVVGVGAIGLGIQRPRIEQ